MEQILTEWKLCPAVIKEILDNAIEVEQLKELSDEHIKQLAPRLGDQLKLTAGIRKLFESNATEAASKPKSETDPTAIVECELKKDNEEGKVLSKNPKNEQSNSRPAKKIKLESSDDDDSESQLPKKKLTNRNKYLPAKLKLVKNLLSEQEMVSDLKEKTGDAFKDCTQGFFKKNAKSVGKFCIINQAKGGQHCPFCMKFISPQVYKSKVNVTGYTWNMTNFRRHLVQKHSKEEQQSLDLRVDDTNPSDCDVSHTNKKNASVNDNKLPVSSSFTEVPLNQDLSGSESEEVSDDESVSELNADAGCASDVPLNRNVPADEVSGQESSNETGLKSDFENTENGPIVGDFGKMNVAVSLNQNAGLHQDAPGDDTSDEESCIETWSESDFKLDEHDVAEMNAHALGTLLPPDNELSSSDESGSDSESDSESDSDQISHDVPVAGGAPVIVDDWRKPGVKFSWVKFSKRSKYLPSFIFPTDGLAQHVTRCGELSDMKFVVNSECVNPPINLKPKAYVRALNIFNLMTGSSFQ